MAGATQDAQEHSRRMIGNVSVLAGATMLSRALGYVRDALIAGVLGAGLGADAFFVAFQLPNLLRRLLSEGTLTLAFVPVFSWLRSQGGQERAFAMARSTMVWLLLLSGTLCAAAMLFAPTVTLLLAPGFADRPAQLELTTQLVRICLPSAVCIGCAALSMGILNALDHFLAPALASCLLSAFLAMSCGLIWLTGWNPAWTLCWAVLIASVVQWLAQQPALAARGFSWRGAWSLGDRGVRRLATLMPPAVFGAAVHQLCIALATLLATLLPGGSVSYIYYADRLVQFPLGIFGAAIGVASLPGLSALASAGQLREYEATLGVALRLTLCITLPATAGLLALSRPIVALLFGHGAFGPEAVSATAGALNAFALGLPAFALVRPLVSASYARQEARAPVLLAFLSLALYPLVALPLRAPLGHAGLAAATSFCSWVNVLGLGILLHLRLKAEGGGQGQGVLRAAALCGALSVALGLAAWAGSLLLPWRNGLGAIALIPLWVTLYLHAARRLGLAEARLLLEMVRRKIRKRKGSHS